MSRRLLIIDAAIAAVIAAAVVIISPGVAAAALVALIVLVACGISFAVDSGRRHPRRPPDGRRGEPGGAPSSGERRS
jgi:hypothetical protein